MKLFPDLDSWFKIDKHYEEHHKCLFFNLQFKPLSDIDVFAKEFAKLICRLRCGNITFYKNLNKKFEQAINNGYKRMHSRFVEVNIKPLQNKEKIYSSFFGQIFYVREQKSIIIKVLTIMEHMFGIYFSTFLECTQLEQADIKILVEHVFFNGIISQKRFERFDKDKILSGNLKIKEIPEDIYKKCIKKNDHKTILDKYYKFDIQKYTLIRKLNIDEQFEIIKILLIDDDAFNGYFGEILFYLLRDKYFKDEKILISPKKPKTSSKESGIDYMEIRKDNGDYYFIIGEIKTTKGTISKYHKAIISTLNNSPKTYLEHVNSLKEMAENQNQNELEVFVDNIPIYFTSDTPPECKRFSGVVNYGIEQKKIDNMFVDFYKDCSNILHLNSKCRIVKLVFIEKIEIIKDKILDIIWKTLLL